MCIVCIRSYNMNWPDLSELHGEDDDGLGKYILLVGAYTHPGVCLCVCLCVHFIFQY